MAESPRPRILYIEDDPGLGTLLQQRLEREGYEVSLAPDSLSGMALHEKTPFDALLIDNSLPGMTGLEVIRKLAPTDTSPPVIMVTGTGDEETAVEAMKLGASDYLVKDFAGVYLRLLATVIKEALFKRHLTRERNEVVKALVQSEHRLKDNLSVFRAIVKGTASDIGEPFYRSLVRHLASALKVRHAFIGQLMHTDPRAVRVLTIWSGDDFGENFEYNLENTPCENVIGREICYYPSNVQNLFPKDHMLTEKGIKCYLGVPLYDAFGNPLGLLSVMHDEELADPSNAKSILNIFAARAEAEIQRQHAEHALIEAKEESERANRAKSEFLSRMSHELRTPMNAVLGFAQIMKMNTNDPLSQDNQVNVQHILTAGKHLMELINEVLDLAHVESGKLLLSKDKVLLVQAIDEALTLIRPVADQNSIKILNKIPKTLETFVAADRVRLNQVLFNLLSNAIKYNRKDGTVTLECENTPEEKVRISVSDTGWGIPKDKLDALFEPFDRLGEETGNVQGTGIGLTITLRLLELMAGSIAVDSTPGQGSRFTIELPEAKIGHQPEPLQNPQAQKSS